MVSWREYLSPRIQVQAPVRIVAIPPAVRSRRAGTSPRKRVLLSHVPHVPGVPRTHPPMTSRETSEMITVPPPAAPAAPAVAAPATGRRYDRSIIEGPLAPAVWKLAWPTMLTNMIGGVQGI